MTFDDIRERTIRTALNLQKRGYEAGQVFGIMAKNSHNVAPVIFAAYCLGCPYNSLATSFVKEEMKHMLNITKPSLIFCDVEAYEKMVESLAECEIEAKIITMNGKIDGCEQIEELFVETGLESMFRYNYYTKFSSHQSIRIFQKTSFCPQWQTNSIEWIQ